jgi:aminoglycoside 6'-N-acetyltransferase
MTGDSSIILRTATLEDLTFLLHWDEQQHNIESDPNDDWNWEVELLKNPPWREQLMAELSRRPIGFIQIIDPLLEETHYWGTVEANQRAIDIWIGEASDLGHGYGSIMMKLAVERCFANPLVNQILIDPLISNHRAHKFYERFGFEFLEQRRFNSDECRVYRLTRANWESLAPFHPRIQLNS